MGLCGVVDSDITSYALVCSANNQLSAFAIHSYYFTIFDFGFTLIMRNVICVKVKCESLRAAVFVLFCVSSILMRVSRFRGANREKGELNAAAWFTQPGKDYS